MPAFLAFLLFLAAIKILEKPNTSGNGDQESQNQAQAAVNTGRVALQTQQAIQGNNQPHKKNDWWPNTLTDWAQVVGVVFLIIYSATTIGLWYVAREANRQTRELVELQNRPWVTWTDIIVDKVNLDIGLVQDLPEGERQIDNQLPFTYKIVNKGKVTATQVASTAIMQGGIGTYSVWEQIAPCQVSDEQLEKKMRIYDVLFPDTPITKRTAVSPPDSAARPFGPRGARFVIVCIAYRNSITNRLHHTKLLYLGRSSDKPVRLPYSPTVDYYPIEELELRATIAD
jgi:hypothetical protein